MDAAHPPQPLLHRRKLGHDLAKIRLLDEEGLGIRLTLHREIAPREAKDAHLSDHAPRAVEVHGRVMVMCSMLVGGSGGQFLQVEGICCFNFAILVDSRHLLCVRGGRGGAGRYLQCPKNLNVAPNPIQIEPKVR